MPAGVTAPEPKTEPVAFDPKVFMATMMDEVNKTINGAVKGLKADVEKMIKVEPKTEPDPKTEPVGEAKTIAELNARINAMNAEVTKTKAELASEKDLRTGAEKAKLESEMTNTFQTVISTFEFATPKAKEQFTNAYKARVFRDDTGNILIKGPKDEPMEMETFLKTEYAESTHLQPAPSRGGAGVQTGKAPLATGKGFSYREDMTPGDISKLSPEARAEYRAQVNDALVATLNQ